MSFASTAEASTAVNVVRTGPRGGTPVVLLHPAGLDLSYWDRQLDALCDLYDVVLFDLPGHGRSAGEPEDWTLENVTRVIAAVVAGTGAEKVHLGGLSLGGMLAQAFAVAHPQSVQSLTLMNTAAVFPEAARSAMRERALAIREGGMSAIAETLAAPWFVPATLQRRPDLRDRALKTLLHDDPLVQAAMWEMIASFDRVADLPRISCPTLVLTGELDEVTPLASAQLLRGSIPHATLAVIPNSAHMSQLEQPHLVNRHLLAFLQTTA